MPGALLPERRGEDLPRSVDVRALVHLLAPLLLRRHVGRGAGAAASLRSEEVRDPEIEELHAPVLAEEDVGGLQVAVHDAALVGMREPLRHLLGDAQGLGRRNRPLGDPPFQGLPPQELHHEVGTGGARSHVVQRHDRGVVEPRHRLGLLLHPAGGGIARRAGQPQRLQCDDPVQLGVERLVDGAEASAPHLAPDLESAHPIAGLKRVLPGIGRSPSEAVEDLLEEPGERAGLAGARHGRAVALFALRQVESPRGSQGG